MESGSDERCDVDFSDCSGSDDSIGDVSTISELLSTTNNGRVLLPVIMRYLHLLRLGSYLGPAGASGFIIKTNSLKEVVLSCPWQDSIRR